MDKKLTRRAVLGTVIGGLAVAPFVTWSLRRPKRLGLGTDSGYVKFRQRFEQRVEFPRTYNGQVNPELSAEKAKKVLSIHRRYWENFSRIDEAEFDYSSRTIIDGKVESDVWSMDAKVKMKYGYGMDARGTDAEGKPVHLYFNLDGDVAPVGRRGESDLSSLMLTFFSSCDARPEMLNVFVDVEEGVELPRNPYIKGNGLYDALSTVIKREPLRYSASYFSQTTGMLELEVRPKDGGPSGCAYVVREYIPVSGIMIPVRDDSYSQQGAARQYKITHRYKNVKVKLVS